MKRSDVDGEGAASLDRPREPLDDLGRRQGGEHGPGKEQLAPADAAADHDLAAPRDRRVDEDRPVRRAARSA